METQFPRVNGAQLNANLGRSVIVIGEVLHNPTPQEVLLRVSDGTQITVRLPMGEPVDSKFMQIMGKVKLFLSRDFLFFNADHLSLFSSSRILIRSIMAIPLMHYELPPYPPILIWKCTGKHWD